MQEKVNQIYCGDNQEVLKTFQDNSICALITDIPYALCDIDALKMIKENADNSGDFLNKKWLLPSVDMLKEFYRVLKTGSYFITTFTPRQDLQCVFYYRLLEAGFDINFSPIYWAYTSGFPKASNYSKVIQKVQNIEMEIVGNKLNINHLNRGDNNINEQIVKTNGNPFNDDKANKINYITKPTTPEAIYCDGLYSNSPKPAVEVIIIAQKPHNKAKYQQALTWYNERKELLDKGIKEEDLCFYTKNASGGVNFDKTRIPVNDTKNGFRPHSANKQYPVANVFAGGKITEQHQQGRFPANILVSDNSLDVFRDFKSGGGDKSSTQDTIFTYASRNKIENKIFEQDSGDLSRYFSLDAWTKKHHQELYKLSKKTLELQEDAEKISPFLFTSKPSQTEKNLGLEEFDKKNKYDRNCKSDSWHNTNHNNLNLMQNTHVCVKPLALFNYLITMFTHENDIVVDPFCGSGATCISSVLTNRKYIGIDINQEYVDIAKARIEYWKKEKEGESKEENNNQPTLFD